MLIRLLRRMDGQFLFITTTVLVSIRPTPRCPLSLTRRRTSAATSIRTILRGPNLFIGVLGCLANAFVLIVLVSSKKSSGSTVNIFVINQSFIDMLACFLVSVASAVALSGIHKFSMPMCILIGGGVTTTLAINASVTSLVLITLERYVKIVHPIVHRNHFAAGWRTLDWCFVGSMD
jgi:hypothetical protein